MRVQSPMSGGLGGRRLSSITVTSRITVSPSRPARRLETRNTFFDWRLTSLVHILVLPTPADNIRHTRLTFVDSGHVYYHTMVFDVKLSKEKKNGSGFGFWGNKTTEKQVRGYRKRQNPKPDPFYLLFPMQPMAWARIWSAKTNTMFGRLADFCAANSSLLTKATGIAAAAVFMNWRLVSVFMFFSVVLIAEREDHRTA